MPDEPRASLTAAARMLGFAWAADRRLTVATFLLLTIQALAGSLFAFWLGLFVDDVTHNRSALEPAIAIGISVTAVAAMDYAGARARGSLSERTQHLLNRRLLTLIGHVPTLEIQETPKHLRQLELLQSESWYSSEAVPSVINALNTALRIAITVVLLASVTPLLLLLPLFGLPSVLLSKYTGDVFNTGNELAAEPARRAEMLYYLAADRAAAKEIRLFRLQKTLLRRFAAEHRTITAIHVRLGMRAEAVRLAARTAFLIGYLGAIVLVAERAAHGAISIGAVVLTAVLAGQVLGLMARSAELAMWLTRTLTAAARYLYLERVATPPAGGGTVPDRLHSGIRLDGVTFRYPGRTEPTLRDITLDLPAGRTIAIVGDNGAGKTTLIKLLAGLCVPTEGRITIEGTMRSGAGAAEPEGIDLRTIDAAAWRERVSAGFQDHARFEFTVQRTVGLGRLPDLDSEPAARAALDRAGATDVLRALPAGLATQLGPTWPDGVDLSGGQWQKLAIGRAMMRPDPLLLLLDEPTAAIDAEAEHQLFARWTQAAREVRQRSGAITVLVSHRFSTVRMADLIVVLSGGGVAEIGSHDELIAAGGLYAELFELQARSYR